MPKLKLDQQRTIIAARGAQFLFTVHIKVKYGWTGDLDTTLLVLADTHEQARRAAAARLVIKEGISLPLDDNHFSETLVGTVDRAPVEPEISPEEFKQMWQGVCQAPQPTRPGYVPVFTWGTHGHLCTCGCRLTSVMAHDKGCGYRRAFDERFGLPAQD